MRCKKSTQKRRVSKPHGQHSRGGSLNPHKHSLRGHTWNGHGKDRVCSNCGCRPRHMRGN